MGRGGFNWAPFAGDRHTCSWLPINNLQRPLPPAHQRLIGSSALWKIFADMSGKDVMAVALLAVLLIATAASSAGNTKKTDVLQKLLTKTENVRMLRGKQQQESQPDLARVERRAQLSDDEREIMTKQIMQALSEMMNTDCMLDRDYQGWVDFGRRDAK